MIRGRWAPELYSYIGGIMKRMNCRLISAGETADHIHLLTSIGKTIMVPDMVMKVKSLSSAWVHANVSGGRKFSWQRGYASFSVSESRVDDVKRYIENQPEHHRRRCFQEELRTLLRKHNLEYNERYLWD
jgi:REP element-mobilizing transposase RayT